jgi:hypothetical protein
LTENVPGPKALASYIRGDSKLRDSACSQDRCSEAIAVEVKETSAESAKALAEPGEIVKAFMKANKGK